jgi:hypothetical protein
VIKRVNFTGRRRIPRSLVDIEVFDGQPRKFDAQINLESIPFLPGAAVFLEATCAGSTVIERFPFGEVGNIQPPAERVLKDVEGENVFFTLKVVDQTKRVGRLLGIAEHIRPQRAGKQTATGRRGILPVEAAELGQELWQLKFGEHDVVLLVNKDVPGLADQVRTEPVFYSAIYPFVVRTILGKAIADNVDIEEDDDRWSILWLRFGKNLHPNRENPPKADDTLEEREEWVEEVTRAFCEMHTLKDKYLSAERAGNGGEA